MTSGARHVAPEAVLSAAAATVLVVQAANAAAERPARIPDADANDVPDWEQVAAGVVEINARISMLVERAKRASAAVIVPDSVRLAGCTTQEAVRSTAQTARLLADAQAAVRTAIAAHEDRRIVTGLPRSVSARPETAAALSDFQRALRNSTTATATANQHPSEPSLDSNPAPIDQILRALDRDACEREQAEVLTAAVSATREDPNESSAYLRTLRTKVAAVNDAVRRRRLVAQWLCALEEPVVAAIEPPGPLLGTAALLRQVVAAESDLTPQLRAQAAEAVEWAASIARNHLTRELMNTFLAGRGYEVDAESDVELSAELRLTRPDWQGEHSADVWVDRHGTVHGRIARECLLEDDRAGPREQDRCAGFNADIEALGRRLGADVVTGDGYVPQALAEGRPPRVEPG
ncbi:MAG TPA: hypothetical protein VFU65_19705 [Actinocrinis sp.]|nr:hypothetical protein [Actinocrinis sp.]